MDPLFHFIIYPVTGLLGTISIIYGSFLFMTSQANPEQIQHGKRYIYGAIIGMIFNFSLLFLIRTIIQLLGFRF